MDNILHAERSLQMAKAHVGTMPTNSVIYYIRKCIFLTPIGILLGHIVCKEGIKFDFEKIKIILDLKPPMNPKQVRVLLGPTGY